MKSDDLRKLLLTLGKNDFEVAKTLEAKGCFGNMNSNSHCPIANFLRKETGEKPYVSPDYICLEKDNREFDNTLSEEYIPVAIEVFILRFDEGEFPELLDLSQ